MKLPRFIRSPKQRLLVIGDLIIDEYHYGTPLGLSAETPTLVARHERTTVSAGGAGSFVQHLLALGGRVTFLTLVGDDSAAEPFRHWRQPRLQLIALRERGRLATVKTRFWVNDYKLLTWDRLDNRPLRAATERRLIQIVTRRLSNFDKVIVSDYRHGLLTETLARHLVALCAKHRKPLYVDSQVSRQASNHSWYQNASLVCCNIREARAIDPVFDPNQLERSLAHLSRFLRVPSIVLKLGAAGSAAWLQGRYHRTQAHRVKVIDSTGAGDAFLAALALAPAPISPLALRSANVWAALATTVIGTTPPARSLLATTKRKRQ